MKLKSSAENILAQEISSEGRKRFENLLSATTLILHKKQQDVPVASDVMLNHLNPIPGKPLIKVAPEDGEPYFTLVFPSVLNAMIKDVLRQYEYSDDKLLVQAVRSDSIHIKKTSIQGIEGSVNIQIRNAILKQKSKIIGTLRGIEETKGSSRLINLYFLINFSTILSTDNPNPRSFRNSRAKKKQRGQVD